MSEESIENNSKDYKPSVSWFLNKKGLLKREGKNGDFYSARVFKGTTLKDGTDISGYTYTFNVSKLKEIKVYESSPDFIKDEEFRNNNGVVYFNEDTCIKLTEPYDKDNPDKVLETIKISAKDLCYAQKHRNRENKDSEVDKAKSGTKERLTDRALNVTNPNNNNDIDKDVDRETNI